MNPFRRTSSLLAAVALAATLGPAAATAAAKAPVQPQCPDRPGRTLAVDGKLRVYQTTVQDKKDPDAATVRVFSCVGRERKAKLLMRNRNNLDLTQTVEKAVLGGGRWIALSMVAQTGVSDGRGLLEFDATTGKQVAQIGTPEDAGPEAGNDSYFDQLQVSKGGAIVYVGATGLVAADTDGLRTLVPKSGTDVPSVFDVALAGTHVYWTVTATSTTGSALVTGHPKGALEG